MNEVQKKVYECGLGLLRDALFDKSQDKRIQAQSDFRDLLRWACNDMNIATLAPEDRIKVILEQQNEKRLCLLDAAEKLNGAGKEFETSRKTIGEQAARILKEMATLVQIMSQGGEVPLFVDRTISWQVPDYGATPPDAVDFQLRYEAIVSGKAIKSPRTLRIAMGTDRSLTFEKVEVNEVKRGRWDGLSLYASGASTPGRAEGARFREHQRLVCGEWTVTVVRRFFEGGDLTLTFSLSDLRKEKRSVTVPQDIHAENMVVFLQVDVWSPFDKPGQKEEMMVVRYFDDSYR